MKKGNVIELSLYRKTQETTEVNTHPSVSAELQSAIQMLILQMRELGPIKKAN